MHIKKNLFVKITTVLFMIMMAGILYASVYNHFYEQTNGTFALVIFAGGLLIVLLITILMLKLFALKSQEKHSVFLILEIIVVGFLMIYGIFLRTMPEVIFNSQNTAYFDIAVSLQKGMKMPNMDQVIKTVMDTPALFGYGELMAGGFALFGTKPEVLFYTNVLFQILSIFFIYRLTRRAAGKVCSVFVLVLCVYMPSQIFSVYTLDSEEMFSCILFGALWLFVYMADTYRKKDFRIGGILCQVLLGVLLGVMAFVTPVSVILAVILLIMQFLCRKKGVLRGLITICATCASFALLLFWMSSSLRVDYIQTASAYAEELIPELDVMKNDGLLVQAERIGRQYGKVISDQGKEIVGNYNSLLYADGLRLETSSVGLLQAVNLFLFLWTIVMALCFGLYVLIGRNIRNRSAVLFMWLCMGALVMLFLKMNTPYNFVFLMELLIILASVGYQYIYIGFLSPDQLPEEAEEEVETRETVMQEVQPQEMQPQEVQIQEVQSQEMQLQEAQIQEVQPQEEQPQEEEKPQIQYIENPLPLPKKHVKKNRIDYAVEPTEDQMKYDIDVADDADWDY